MGDECSELRIILVGKTGAGKSTTGNTILGRENFKVDFSPVAVTEMCEEGSVDRGGRRIHVVDTPGISGSLSEEQMKEQINQCIRKSVPGPHAFLLVISLGSFTEDEKNAVKWIQDNIGEDAAIYTIVLFTREDQLGSKSLEKFISESEDLQELIERCYQRCHVFNNQNRGNNRQVTELLEKIDAMVKSNGGQHYTNEMFEKAQKKIRVEILKNRLKEIVEKVNDFAQVAATTVSETTAAVVKEATAAVAGGATVTVVGAAVILRSAYAFAFTGATVLPLIGVVAGAVLLCLGGMWIHN